MNYWIVVVDDEVMGLTNAKTILSDQNMRVSCLRSGRDLLKFMETHTPDLILLDILMPDMDGFETYRELRKMEELVGRKRTPVIFLSGAEDSETERRGLKEGASDFIRKPFNKEVLIRRIDNAITNAKTIESLTEEATIDGLTGFLNKSSGTDRISKLCEEQVGALMLFDLDNFKLVNDLYGHDMGDRVLVAFADVVRHNVRGEDVVARIGGDEFMAFFSDMQKEAAVAALTKRLNDQFVGQAEKLIGKELDIPLGVTVGVAMVPEHGRDYETLFPLADGALYTAKQNGKHGYAIFRKDAESGMSSEENLKRELARITKIVEERNGGNAPFVLGPEPFSFIYRFAKRFYTRHGGNAAKMLFILSKDGSRDARFLIEESERFCEVLQKTLRKSDFILQNKPNQFFLFLPELTEPNFPKVIHRIMDMWEKCEHDGVKVEYIIEPIVYEASIYSSKAGNE